MWNGEENENVICWCIKDFLYKSLHSRVRRNVKMVFFGRKEKIEDRRLLASIDAVNGTKLYQIENGKATMLV